MAVGARGAKLRQWIPELGFTIYVPNALNLLLSCLTTLHQKFCTVTESGPNKTQITDNLAASGGRSGYAGSPPRPGEADAPAAQQGKAAS